MLLSQHFVFFIAYERNEPNKLECNGALQQNILIEKHSNLLG
jgi:hypothetical protein